MKNLLKLLSALAVTITIAACTNTNEYNHQKHNYNDEQVCTQCGKKNCEHKNQHKKHKTKLYSKMYTRNNHGEPSEIGYVKFYDIDDGVKMVVNVDKLRDDIDYTTKIYQCTDAKCTNPDTCCMETTMSLEMPLTRNDKTNSSLQKTFIINNVSTDQLQGATIFFERDKGYRAAWGFLD